MMINKFIIDKKIIQNYQQKNKKFVFRNKTYMLENREINSLKKYQVSNKY